MVLIVILEDANTVDPAKAGEKTATAAQHHRPGLDTTIGKVIWIRIGFSNLGI